MAFYAVTKGSRRGVYFDKQSAQRAAECTQNGYVVTCKSVSQAKRLLVSTEPVRYCSRPVSNSKGIAQTAYIGAADTYALADTKAAYGVWYDTDDARNIACRLPDGQTRKRAYLYAILQACNTHLGNAQRHNPLCIVSTSKYAVNSIASYARRAHRESKASKSSKSDSQMNNADLLLELYNVGVSRINLSADLVSEGPACRGVVRAENMAREQLRVPLVMPPG